MGIVEWRSVVGYEGHYEVSSEGEVRSLDRVVPRSTTPITKRGRILSPNRHYNGYVTVHLCLDGEKKRRLVHRLVAEAFLENPDGGNEVNHRDFNRSNNAAGNLEWMSSSENKLHSVKYGRITGSAKMLTRSLVAQVRTMAAEGGSRRAVARHFGISDQRVRHICGFRLWLKTKEGPA